MDILKFLELVSKEAKDLEEKAQNGINKKVEDLKALLLVMKKLVLGFGEKGWFKKLWQMKKHTKSLVRLHKEIDGSFDNIKDLFNLESQKSMMKLIKERVYPLEDEIARRVNEKMNDAGIKEGEARAELIKDPDVVTETAKTGNVPLEELKTEIEAFRAEMGGRFDHTDALISKYGEELKTMIKQQFDEADRTTAFMLVIVRLPVRIKHDAILVEKCFIMTSFIFVILL